VAAKIVSTDGGAIRIRISARETILDHARTTHPRECCGLVIGTSGEIVRAWPASNLAERDTRFLVDPRDHFEALRAARAGGLRVIGAYHSHPASPAEPSAVDLAEANDPAFLMLIAVADLDSRTEIRAFYLEERNFREVPLVPVP
jgi:proteasome lid subunit RPN8/RPN11